MSGLHVINLRVSPQNPNNQYNKNLVKKQTNKNKTNKQTNKQKIEKVRKEN